MQLKADDVRLNWVGAVSLEINEKGVMPWRIPHGIRNLYHSQLQEKASMPAGVRFSFHSNTEIIKGQIANTPNDSQIDLYCDGQWIKSYDLKNANHFLFENLPAGQKLVELWLPQKSTFLLKSLELSSGAIIKRYDDTQLRWITYGSSITQCAGAKSPSFTWPAIVARQNHFNLTCLGFGGQCHLDLMIARLIRDLPADFVSICCGINIYGASSLGPRAFQQSIIGTILTIREGHPDIPIALISPIYSPTRENSKNAAGFTLAQMRNEIFQTVTILKEQNDENLFYFDGLTIFGPELNQYLPDQLHPNAEGYRCLAANFQRLVVNTIFGSSEN